MEDNDKIPEFCKQCEKMFWRTEPRKYCPLCKKDYRKNGPTVKKESYSLT